jgi:tetraprenyl-beta-curcumene synthase
MSSSGDAHVSLSRALLALCIANARYWSSVAPVVRRELRRWERRAGAIANPILRGHALGKLREERFNAEVAATLSTLAPKRLRRRVIAAIVAFQVIYDYLDVLSEQLVVAPLDNGRQLYRAFAAALSPGESAIDYYRHNPQRDDGGYLDALVATCRAGFHALPAAAIVAPVAQRTAARCGEAQTRTHAIVIEGPAQLEGWAANQLPGQRLTWWELAAGCAASVLAVHALIAAAADPRTTQAEALRIDAAYLPICALTTLLDSLVDRDADLACGDHAYLSYYADDAAVADRVRAVAREAMAGAQTLRHASHHTMSVSGAAAYYLSAPGAGAERARPISRDVARELKPLIAPIMQIFHAWRLAKRIAGRRAGRARRAPLLAHVGGATGRSQSASVRGARIFLL